VNETHYKDKVAKAERLKRNRINELKKQRADHKLKGVIVNTEERDKKFAHKYWVKELPHNFDTVEQYKKVMNVAVGKEWTTLQSHKRLI